jgi:hypothetical protein
VGCLWTESASHLPASRKDWSRGSVFGRLIIIDGQGGVGPSDYSLGMMRPVTGAVGFCLHGLLVALQLNQMKIANFNDALPFLLIAFRAQILRAAAETIQMVLAGLQRKVMRADSEGREVRDVNKCL